MKSFCTHSRSPGEGSRERTSCCMGGCDWGQKLPEAIWCGGSIRVLSADIGFPSARSTFQGPPGRLQSSQSENAQSYSSTWGKSLSLLNSHMPHRHLENTNLSALPKCQRQTLSCCSRPPLKSPFKCTLTFESSRAFLQKQLTITGHSLRDEQVLTRIH